MQSNEKSPAPPIKAGSTEEQRAIAKMRALVPDAIPRVARQVLTVTYSGGVDVVMGGVLTPAQAASEPVSIWFQAAQSCCYTLMMVDVDAPTAKDPWLRHWRHWLVVNIPSSCDVRAGDTITEYSGPCPPRGTGLHRYAFLVYAQGTNRISERGRLRLDGPWPIQRGQVCVRPQLPRPPGCKLLPLRTTLAVKESKAGI
ncbi:hypothetical protein HPB48_003951 [Haemaphysalis longicornis]|uniref:Phosphatidylethanolamine binding protein n=1 Tax=Haemaphysalis longicornis TaxID=44386 RepID=A0A9J6GU97_HAELO|nr:hypothetical protein HPB48_003951 [Haemaphysalis longicornis]